MNDLCALGMECKYAGLKYRGLLCELCAAGSERDIALLVFDYHDLVQLLPVASRPSDVNISRPKSASRPPLDMRILTLCEDIHRMLRDGEDRVASFTGRPPLRGYARPGFEVQRAAATVGPYAPHLSIHDGGIELLRELRRLHHIARGVLGVHERFIGLPGECPDRTCRQRRLRRRDGSDVVTCQGCRGQWAYSDYQRYVTLKVSEIKPVTRSGDGVTNP